MMDATKLQEIADRRGFLRKLGAASALFLGAAGLAGVSSKAAANQPSSSKDEACCQECCPPGCCSDANCC